MTDLDKDVTEQLRAIVKEAVIKEMGESGKGRPLHAVIVDITKAGSIGMKAMANLKGKKMPTEKAARAVESSVDALRAVFADMLRNPTNYLDTGNPQAVVQQRVQQLGDRENALRDHDMGATKEPMV